MNFEELFDFENGAFGGIALKEYKPKNDPTVTELTIPSEYNGEPITDLSPNVFQDSKHLRSIYVPDSVKRIWGCAFESCTALEKVRLPEKLFMFNSYIFWKCHSLKEVSLPKNLTDIPVSCFMGCMSLEHIELPEGIGKVETWAFAGCSRLKEITLPESVKVVDGMAFNDCVSLENIIFKYPKTYITGTFENCPKLSADLLLMSALYTADIENTNFGELSARYIQIDWKFLSNEKVFRRALELNKFDGCDTSELVKELVGTGCLPNIITVSERGWLTAENIGGLIEIAAENEQTEMTAWLLDYQNRKFGINGENNYDL